MLDADNDDNKNHTHTCVEDVRDMALECFHTFLEKMCGEKLPAPSSEMTEFLTTQETVMIIKEHCNIFTEEEFGIGADSEEEYKEKMLKMMHALGERIMSNLLHTGVKRGLLDSEYDIDKGAFAFELTEKGKTLGTLIDKLYGEDNNRAAGSDQSVD
jgi:hypothetical protein